MYVSFLLEARGRPYVQTPNMTHQCNRTFQEVPNMHKDIQLYLSKNKIEMQ